MKAVLVRVPVSIYWIDDAGQKHEGTPSGVSGNLSGVYGNLGNAEITDEEREVGIDVEALMVKP